MTPRRKIAAAFVLLLGAMLALVRVRWDQDAKRLVTDGTLIAVSGDEPHYICIVNSILFDHDLMIGDDYLRAYRGSAELGLRHRSLPLDHHTIVIDRTTNEHALWGLVYDKAQKQCDGCVEFGRRVERFPPNHALVEVPAHPVAFSAILAGAIALFRPTLETTERDVGIVLVIVSWGTIALTYLLARRAFRSRGPALAAAALLLFCSPWLPYTRSYFSDPMIGFFLVAASFAMVRRKIVFAAIAVSFAMLIKLPFVLCAAAFIIDCALKKRWRDALVLSAIVGGFGLALMAFNFHLAGTPLIAGTAAPPLGGLRAMFDTLLDGEHGLIPFTPWAPFAFAGVVGSLRHPWHRRTALATVFFFGLMCATGFGPGHCYGPRYWVPLLPWLAIEAVRVVLRARWPTRVIAYGSVALGAAIAISGLLLYTESFSMVASRWW